MDLYLPSRLLDRIVSVGESGASGPIATVIRLDPTKVHTMSAVLYRGYRIELEAVHDPVRGQWQPYATVMLDTGSGGSLIASDHWQDTQALADAFASERAKAWVDGKT